MSISIQTTFHSVKASLSAFVTSCLYWLLQSGTYMIVFLFIFFKTSLEICWIGISKYLAIFFSFFTTCINSSVIPSGYEYKNLIQCSSFILQSSVKSSASFDFPYKSTPYFVVSWAIIINSLIPFFAIVFASSKISSIGLLTNNPLMYGIAQYVHILLQPSPIFK